MPLNYVNSFEAPSYQLGNLAGQADWVTSGNAPVSAMLKIMDGMGQSHSGLQYVETDTGAWGSQGNLKRGAVNPVSLTGDQIGTDPIVDASVAFRIDFNGPTNRLSTAGLYLYGLSAFGSTVSVLGGIEINSRSGGALITSRGTLLMNGTSPLPAGWHTLGLRLDFAAHKTTFFFDGVEISLPDVFPGTFTASNLWSTEIVSLRSDPLSGTPIGGHLVRFDDLTITHVPAPVMGVYVVVLAAAGCAIRRGRSSAK